MKHPTNLLGKRFGRLTVIEYAGRNRHNKPQWQCICDCGNEVVVVAASLTRGVTTSCGCYHKETVRDMNKTHGESTTRLYKTWRSMKYRCLTPTCKDYALYGGRGITVCDEWMQYENFREWALHNGYDESLTIERIDGNGNYEPSNCKWATRLEQANNLSSNHYLTADGRTMTLTQWVQETGLKAPTILTRLSLGWSEEEAVTLPLGSKRPIHTSTSQEVQQ